MIDIALQILFDIGLTLGVGSSTFALIFYIRALEDGTIDASERRFMHTVYVVLRIGMALLFISLCGYLIQGGFADFALHSSQWVLLGVILLNALLMTYRLISMQVGPILAGGSWYSLFAVSKTPIAQYDPIILLVLYVLFLVVFYLLFNMLKSKFTVRKER